MDELKPCPFCGGGGYWRQGRCEPSFYIACKKCETIGPVTITLETAITAWNTRAASGGLNEQFGVNEQSGISGQLASLEQRAGERLPALARTHEGQKLYSLAYARGRQKGRQDATVDLGVIGTAEQPALGDHQDKPLAWDAVCMALNTYAPGWANSEEKTGMQSAVAAIAALSAQPPSEAPAFYAVREGRFVSLDNITWGRWRLDSKEFYDQCVAKPIRMPGGEGGTYGYIYGAVALYAAPQPREVRGVDGLVELAKVLPMPDGYELAQELPGIWGYVYNRDDGERMASGTSWNHPALAGVAAWQDVAAATARQDAAGVEPAAWMATSKPSSDGTVAIQFTHNPDYANECRRADWTVTPLYTTPPPGVDVGKLRELRSLLVGIRPEFGQPGSRDVDVRAQQNRIDAAIAIIDGAAPGVGEAVRSVCKWSQQDEGYEVFSTSCGHEYQVNDCTDGNVQLPFCPFCARRVEGSAWAQGDDPLTPTTPPDGAKGER